MKRKPDPRIEMCEEYYDVLIAALKHVAYRCGYAITVHGSLKRDIDLVACPWRDSCISANSLVKDLREAAEIIIGFGELTGPEKKPCGRLAYSIHLTYEGPRNCYLDISVMPSVVRIFDVTIEEFC